MPVLGDHVILNGVPTGMLVGRVVKEKGFCARASVANVERRRVEKCIVGGLAFFLLSGGSIEILGFRGRSDGVY